MGKNKNKQIVKEIVLFFYLFISYLNVPFPSCPDSKPNALTFWALDSNLIEFHRIWKTKK